MRSILFVVLLLVINQVSNAQETKIKESMADAMTISLDKVAFDNNSYMNILDSDNNIVAYYDRFENKSGPVKSVNLFNLEKELICVLVPLITDKGYEIHLRDKDNSRGFLKLVGKMNGFDVSYQSEVAYFKEPYDFDYAIHIGIGKVAIDQSVNYKNQEVISYNQKISAFSGIKTSPIVVRKSFFLENKLDVANWVLVLELIEELSSEVSKNNRNRRMVGVN